MKEDVEAEFNAVDREKTYELFHSSNINAKEIMQNLSKSLNQHDLDHLITTLAHDAKKDLENLKDPKSPTGFVL